MAPWVFCQLLEPPREDRLKKINLPQVVQILAIDPLQEPNPATEPMVAGQIMELVATGRRQELEETIPLKATRHLITDQIAEPAVTGQTMELVAASRCLVLGGTIPLKAIRRPITDQITEPAVTGQPQAPRRPITGHHRHLLPPTIALRNRAVQGTAPLAGAMARMHAIPATVAPPVAGNAPAEEAMLVPAAAADVLRAEVEEEADALPEDANEIKIEILIL